MGMGTRMRMHRDLAEAMGMCTRRGCDAMRGRMKIFPYARLHVCSLIHLNGAAFVRVDGVEELAYLENVFGAGLCRLFASLTPQPLDRVAKLCIR